MNAKQPKYLHLTNWIKEKIQTDGLSEGDKFFTEKDLSKMFNVSRQTVRQSLAILEKEGVLESRQGSGTFVKGSEKVTKSETKTIGVLITYFDDYIFPSIIQGIESMLAKNGYSMQLACTHNNAENEARALSSMLDNNVCGLIIEPTKSALPNYNLKLYEEIKRREIPTIFFNAYYPNLDFPYVALDDLEAGKMAAECLLKKGHRKIAAALKSDDIQGHLRYKGIMQAIVEADAEFLSENIFWYTTEDIKYLAEDFARLERYLKGCTALVCYNDKVASIVMKCLKNNGVLVPHQMSISSIDNSELATLCDVPLTSVVHPKKKLGMAVAQNMLRLISGEDFDATIKFVPTIVERQSVSGLAHETIIY